MNLAEAYPWASWVIAAVCAALVGWQYRDKLAALAKPILALVKRAPSVVLPDASPTVPDKMAAMVALDTLVTYGQACGSTCIVECCRKMAADVVSGCVLPAISTVVDTTEHGDG